MEIQFALKLLISQCHGQRATATDSVTWKQPNGGYVFCSLQIDLISHWRLLGCLSEDCRLCHQRQG